jgi:hypothetical protein
MVLLCDKQERQSNSLANFLMRLTMTETNENCKFKKRMETIAWDDHASMSQRFDTAHGVVQTRYGRFQGGLADQIEVVELNSNTFRLWVLPTRGMSIWCMESDGVMFGWESPIDGPVHPAFVPIHDPDGFGWLEGFDELFVRCGIESNGAPEHDDRGGLVYPLHGRIGNLAASGLQVQFDQETERLELSGEVRESRLFFKKFKLKTRLSINVKSATVDIFDEVTNELATPTSMQLLYHINVGKPVLGKGATIELPINELAPKDELSASEIDNWDRCDSPSAGYSERVYFATLRSDENDITATLLKSADGTSGLGVTYGTQNLPRFIVWKNTAAVSDGYVTGLEPATNYPNTKTFEAKQERVVQLGPGQTVVFQVSLHLLTSAESVSAMSKKIADIVADKTPKIHRSPREGWSDIQVDS